MHRYRQSRGKVAYILQARQENTGTPIRRTARTAGGQAFSKTLTKTLARPSTRPELTGSATVAAVFVGRAVS